VIVADLLEGSNNEGLGTEQGSKEGTGGLRSYEEGRQAFEGGILRFCRFVVVHAQHSDRK
jgi:hypothetical protein